MNLFLKRCFDIICSLIGLIFLSPIFLIIAIGIKIDSKGPVLDICNEKEIEVIKRQEYFDDIFHTFKF